MISIFSVQDYVHELTELTLTSDNEEVQAASMSFIASNFGSNKNMMRKYKYDILTNSN